MSSGYLTLLHALFRWRNLSAWLSLHLAVLLFGAAGVIGFYSQLSALQLVSSRSALGALALILLLVLGQCINFCLILRRKKQGSCKPISLPRPTALSKRIIWALLLSGLVLAAHWWTFFYAIKQGHIGIALVGFSAFPVIVLGLECLLGWRILTWQSAASTCLVVIGVWIVAPTSDAKYLTGLVYGVVSGALFALLTLQNKILVSRLGGLRLGMWQQSVAALCCLMWVFFVSSNTVWQGFQWQWHDWLNMLILGMMFTALPHVLFIRSLTSLPAHTAAIVSSLEPVYGIALAWLLLAQAPGVYTLIGIVIILAGVVFNHLTQMRLLIDPSVEGN